MHSLPWPPELDAIKVEPARVQGRIKGTEIWLELNLTNPMWHETEHSREATQAISAWLALFNKDSSKLS